MGEERMHESRWAEVSALVRARDMKKPIVVSAAVIGLQREGAFGSNIFGLG